MQKHLLVLRSLRAVLGVLDWERSRPGWIPRRMRLIDLADSGNMALPAGTCMEPRYMRSDGAVARFMIDLWLVGVYV